MSPSPRLVLGTRNRKKAEELVDLLLPLGLELMSLAEIPESIEIEEDGDTFEANARKKAVDQARHLQQWVLGEDSGLVVDALGGRPGVFSARYAGPSATDEANNALLLKELADTPLAKRTAHYVCHAVIANSAGDIVAEAIGRCQGVIRFKPSGSGGFGYDPLFEVREYHRTFGDLGPTAKASLSHRARALGQLLPRLKILRSAGQWT